MSHLFHKQVLLIGRGQRQIMHQLDNLSNLLHEYWGERSRQERTERANRSIDFDSMIVPLIITLAVGGLSIFLLKGLSPHK